MAKTDINRLRKELSTDRSELRKAAFEEIKTWDASESLPILVDLLNSKNEDVIDDIASTFQVYKDEALPYLVNALSSEIWTIRRGASVVLAKLGPETFDKIMNMVPENEEDVDYWMVQTLGNMGNVATKYLIKIFKHQNQKVRLAAIRAAQNIEDPVMVEHLLTLLDEQSWPIRKAAFDSLEDIYQCNIEAVVKALDNSSDEARFWIIKLLAQEESPELVNKFQNIIETSPIESKIEAIKALAQIETDEAHKILVGCLANKSWIIRKTAADAIWEQGLGVSEELVSAIRGSNVDARYWSVKLLGQTHEPKVFEEIAKCLQDSQVSVRAAACQALGSLGDKRALSALMNMLNDESEDVRTAAILSLSQIGEKLAAEPSSKVAVPKINQSVPAHLKPENMIKCQECGKMIGKDFSFCPFCLTSQKTNILCKQCGTQLQRDWKGCPNCGHPVS